MLAGLVLMRGFDPRDSELVFMLRRERHKQRQKKFKELDKMDWANAEHERMRQVRIKRNKKRAERKKKWLEKEEKKEQEMERKSEERERKSEEKERKSQSKEWKREWDRERQRSKERRETSV